MSEQPKDASALLDEAAEIPNADALMERCPDNASDGELRASIAIWRAERASWRTR